MRRPVLLAQALFAAGFSLCLVSLSAAADGPGRALEVRRMPAAGHDTLATRRALLQAAGRAEIEERERLWRSYPDFLTPPHVNWSRDAARRRGWRQPGPARNRAATFEAATSALAEPGGPPDTIRVAIIRIDFATDRGGEASSGSGRFDLSAPGEAAVPVDRPPHNRSFYLAHFEAMSRYWRAQSYGRTIVVGDVWPRSQNGAYRCADMADFGPWRFSQDIYPAAVQMFRSMLFAADTQSTRLGDRIPWDQYDRYILLHAGSDLQNDVRQDSPEDIPSFTIGVGDSDVVIFADSTAWNRQNPIDRASVLPETDSQDGYYGAINGVIVHEGGHLLFGLSDLYDVDTNLPRVGEWSLMDSGNLVGSLVLLPDKTEIFAIGLLPPSVDPFQRSFLTDALAFREAAYGDTMPLRSSQRHPDVRAVLLSRDEYLLLENRYLAPATLVELKQDDVTRVVLGPSKPDTLEYDALLPGGGILVWHVDESVFPNEFTFPCDTARANRGCGVNTNPRRLGVSVVEADALADLGDLNSPYWLGSPFDPYFRSNNSSLSDTTRPNLVPHIGTRPHVRLDFLDEADSTMRFSAMRTWQLPGWPIQVETPAGGPQLLAVDVDGDRLTDVCWAGGDPAGPDSASLFAVRASGEGIFGPSPVFSRALDRRPLGALAAIARPGDLRDRPPVLAVSTRADGPDTNTAGGRVWLIDADGLPLAGWPARLPAIVTTPPVLVGVYRDTFVYVGCADGRVYALGLDGEVRAASEPPLAGGIRGRLAVYPELIEDDAGSLLAVAAGGGAGQVGVFAHRAGLSALPGWPQTVGPAGFEPDFLWLDFGGTSATGPLRVPDGSESGAESCFSGALSLVVHHADWLWAFCASGEALRGWGRNVGDTLAAGLGAGDPDADGFPEVLTQSVSSRVAFWNLDGYPSPGWPRRGSSESFRSGAAPLAADLERSGGTHVIAMNASGIVTAMGPDGAEARGWPLATGLGAVGSPVLADLDGDHFLELVAADARGGLFAYTLPTRDSALVAISWPMLGGDPGRTSALPSSRASVRPLPASGPLVRGSLKAYPNPARRRPVTFAYRLTEPATVVFRLLDTSGHEVASFTRAGRQSDNVEVWEPGALPAGLYLAHIRFRGATSEYGEVVPVGLLR